MQTFCQTKLNYCVFRTVRSKASKQNYWWSFLKIEKIASYEFKMKNWFPFPMTSKGKTFMKSKCGASMLCSPRQEKWKKKTSSTIWKHCERGSSCRINFSHSFLLIIAYLIIEVAAFQQNLGRQGKKTNFHLTLIGDSFISE